MADTTLAIQIQRKDYSAQGTAARLGPGAAASIVALTTDGDREVRLLALVCLDITGGAPAIAAAFERLGDPDQQVASRAVMLLRNHPPAGEEKQLLAAFLKIKDPFIRSQLPLVAGSLAPNATPRSWAAFLPGNPDEDVQHGLRLGLARMGDQPSRQWLIENLSTARGPDVRRWIEDSLYISQDWVLPTLARLLDRTERAQEVMPDDGRHRYLRTSDLAASAILRISGARVSFAFPRIGQFSAVELAEVKRIAAAEGDNP